MLDRCVALGLPFRRAEVGGRLFDPVVKWNFVECSQSGPASGDGKTIAWRARGGTFGNGKSRQSLG